jgi:hypothetical protein
MRRFVTLFLIGILTAGPCLRISAAAKAIQESQGSVTPLSRIVTIPSGTVVEIETAYRISSQEVRAGEAITFRVVNPVKVGDVIVIAAGSVATGRIIKASRGGHFGRAGRLAWTMETVTAIDGSRIPIQAAGRVVGDSKGAKVATQMAITGALLGPFAPVALMFGFKRGENAYLAQGRRYEVIVMKDTTIRANDATESTTGPN